VADRKTTFALFFGNRGSFPASPIAEAREELPRVLKEWGYDVLMLGEDATRYGAVETRSEGEIYANFLQENRGRCGGIILCLSNFGDETGAVVALRDAGVPILLQAYPDDLDKMAPGLRRDAFCGKISITNVFSQFGVKFTSLKPHVVVPSTDQFKANVHYFDRVCRVANGLKGMVIGAIGARTTPFKTVRIDEIALQRHGVTVETLDLSDVIARVHALRSSGEAYEAKTETLKQYTAWGGVPNEALDKIARFGVVLDAIIEEYQMDAIAVRCSTELQKQLGISVCVLMGELNNRGVPAACEADIGNAVAMYALHLASGEPAACLDWNNNYGEEDNKCILFHCGPVPRDLMADRGRVTDHAIRAKALGAGCGYGCHAGRIAPFDFTFGSMLTDSGSLRFYLGQGAITKDEIPPEFFGCAGVARIESLQDVLLFIGQDGHRHHVSLTPGLLQAPLREALERYLGFEVAQPQQDMKSAQH
jgi:L-fucose isomerase-like protein